jgi:hypothetical protein
MANSSCLKGWYQSTMVEKRNNPTMGVTTDVESSGKIKSWWTEKRSSIICIQKSAEDTNEITLSSGMVALAQAAKIPVAAYFWQRISSDGGYRSQADNFIHMVYSLVYQVGNSITEDCIDSGDMSAERFLSLDGSVESLPRTLELLSDILSAKSHSQLVVVDGMEPLDFHLTNDSGMEKLLQIFLELLQKDRKATIKTMITTEQHSELILNEIGWENMVDASNLGGFISLADIEAGFLEGDTV